jgi:plasmid stability protein
MATLKIDNIDDGLVARLQAVAAEHSRTPEQEAAEILSRELKKVSPRHSWVTKAREIAAMSPESHGSPDAVDLLREDRAR